MYAQLLRFRLRWYLRTSADLVMRHWQWALLACLVVPGPPIVAVFLDAASLLAASASPHLSPIQHLVVAIVIDAAAVLWIVPQRHALSGGAFMRYADALPISRSVRVGVDATLLIAADSVLLVAVVIAAIPPFSPPRDPSAAFALLAVLGLAGIAQLAILRRRRIVLLAVLLGDGMVAAPVASARWVLPIAAIAVAVVAVSAAERLARRGHRPRQSRGTGPMAAGLRILARRTPALLIQCKAIAERPSQTGLRLVAALALALGADRLVAIFHFDNRTRPTVILAMAAISFLLAGFYRILRDARRPMASYLAALPLSPRYWPVRDTQFVLLLNAVPLVILLSPQISRGLLSLLVTLALAVMYQVLLALLRWPVIHGGRRSLLYGVLLAAVWSGASIAAVSR